MNSIQICIPTRKLIICALLCASSLFVSTAGYASGGDDLVQLLGQLSPESCRQLLQIQETHYNRTRKSAPSADKFTFQLPLQPKKTIISMIAKEGIRVPKIHSRLQSAIDELDTAGKDFLIRSEHPQEYIGISGLLESYRVTKKTLKSARNFAASPILTQLIQTQASHSPRVFGAFLFTHKIPFINFALAAYFQAVKMGAQLDEAEKILNRILLQDYNFQKRLTSLENYADNDLTYFLSQASFSYWEYIPGINRVMVADTAVPHRFHVFSETENNRKKSKQYLIFESGQIIRETHSGSPFPSLNLPELVQFYEQVRWADGMHHAHAPLIEFQTAAADQNHYLLQVHRTQDTHYSSPFQITDQQKQGAFSAELVRGRTPPEGTVFEIEFNKPERERYLTVSEITDSNRPDGWYGDYGVVVSEFRARASRLQIINSTFEQFSNTSGYHLSKSLLFKPEVSIMIDPKIFHHHVSVRELEDAQKSGKRSRLRFLVISNGREAYWKIL